MPSQSDIKRFLAGGVGALLGDARGDGARVEKGTPASPPERPEQTAPEPQLNDREPFLRGVTQTQILVGTAVLVAAIGLVAFARGR